MLILLIAFIISGLLEGFYDSKLNHRKVTYKYNLLLRFLISIIIIFFIFTELINNFDLQNLLFIFTKSIFVGAAYTANYSLSSYIHKKYFI